MKTIYDWLCELPEPLNEMEIDECLAEINYAFTESRDSLDRALFTAFTWYDSDMGHDFWWGVYSELGGTWLDQTSTHL